MTAAERYESVWNKFLVALKRDPSSCLSSLQVKYHINRRGMCKWMKEHSLSVREMKRQILADQKTLPEKRTCFFFGSLYFYVYPSIDGYAGT